MGQARADGENDLMTVAKARRPTGTQKPSGFDGVVQLDKIFFEKNEP
jgi:hypothetical protein